MKLLNIKIRNFKGLQEFQLSPEGNDAKVFGDNGTGKTTIADSVTWLLTDKDSKGQAVFDIKTRVDGEPMSNAEHSVYAEILASGKTVKLQKIYKEKWTKKRGSARAEFTGHVTEHFVDDIPVGKREYQAAVSGLSNRDDLLHLLTNPTAFFGLHWEKQRSMLIDICGDITDEQVISANKEFTDIPAILNGKSCDDRRKAISSQRKKINDQLDSIPNRIDEQERSKPELTVTNAQHLVGRLDKMREQQWDVANKEAAIKAGGGAAEIRENVSQVNAEILSLQNEINIEWHAKNDATYQETRQLSRKHEEIGNGLETMVKVSRRLDNEISELESNKSWLKSKWIEENGRVFLESGCPTCGQSMPDFMVKEARERFNVARAKSLADIDKEGSECAKKISERKAKIDQTAKEHKVLCYQYIDLQEQIDAISIPEKPTIESDPRYQLLINRRNSLQADLDSMANNKSAALEKLAAERDAIQDDIAKAERELSAIESFHRSEDRISELKKQEKDLAAEFEKLECHLSLIEQFISAKMSLLEERINDRFEVVNFSLFRRQINDGISPWCEATIDGVPFHSWNTAAEIQGGMDIIKALSAHFNFRPFIFVDRLESVTSLPEIDTQVIGLVVSESDKTLRIEMQ